MTSLSQNSQALPSLSSLIQGIPSQSEPHPQKLPMDVNGSFDPYHHDQHHHHMGMPKPINTYDTLDTDSREFSMPSPVSPRTTRCPSLSGSIYSTSSNSSASPTDAYPSRSSFSSSSTRDVLRYTLENSRISKGYIGGPGYHGHHEEKLSKHEKRRRNHLNSEKKRRENIKSGMDALFQLVPACRDQQESKANILKKTRDYIVELQSVIGGIEGECRRLVEENSELKRRASGKQGGRPRL